MNSEVLKIEWDEYIKSCYSLANLIKYRELNNLPIIAISRGGFLPGLIISHHNDNPKVQVLGVSSYNDVMEIPQRRHKLFVTQTPNNISDSSVLVIDDLVDTGKTLTKIKEYFKDKKIHAYTAVVYSKNPDYKVDIKYKEIDPKKWIIFPYEKR